MAAGKRKQRSGGSGPRRGRGKNARIDDLDETRNDDLYEVDAEDDARAHNRNRKALEAEEGDVLNEVSVDDSDRESRRKTTRRSTRTRPLTRRTRRSSQTSILRGTGAGRGTRGARSAARAAARANSILVLKRRRKTPRTNRGIRRCSRTFGR